MAIQGQDAEALAKSLDNIARFVNDNCGDLDPRLSLVSKDLYTLASGIRNGEQMMAGIEMPTFIRRFQIGDYGEARIQPTD